jgi:RIP metalloprotease RseP
VSSWFDLHNAIKNAQGPVTISYQELDENAKPHGTEKTAALPLSEAERKTIANIRYDHELMLAERIEPRKTSNPLEAAAWGVTETRDLLRQFYITLHRLTTGDVNASNFMGPIGIVHTGSHFAFKGWDWLIWFLAMISANLAVVNFLPIPIVDGGLFVFLIVEKIKGKPLSPRMQTVAQLVGLAIILSVFLFVTYQDIRRMIL